MKKRVGILAVGILLTLTSITALSSPRPQSTAHADSLIGITPVFSGNEKNAADTVESVILALKDPALKQTLVDAVATVQATPPKGSDAAVWIGYVLAVVGVVFGVFHYLAAKLKNTGLLRNIETHLATIASAPPVVVNQHPPIENREAKPAKAPAKIKSKAPTPPDVVSGRQG